MDQDQPSWNLAKHLCRLGFSIFLVCVSRLNVCIWGRMGRTGTRLPGFCLNRIRPHVRVRSPPIQSKPEPNAVKPDRQTDNPGGGGVEEEKPGNREKPGQATGRRIMIVVDSSIEAKGALQWALSHTVQSQDIMILLHVTKPGQQGLNSSCTSLFWDLFLFEYMS